MTWPILPDDFEGIRQGEAIELVRIEYPRPGVSYRKVAKLYYFEGIEDEGVYLGPCHPPAPEDVIYVKFDRALFNELRRLRYQKKGSP